MIKAILLDIDGTLRNSNQEITKDTLEALKKAQDSGIRLVIASGRATRGLYQFARPLEMDHHHGLFVSYNGGQVVDCQTNEILYDVPMNQEDVHDVLEHIKQFDICPIVTHGDHMLVNDVFNCYIDRGGETINILQYESRSNDYLLMEIKDLAEYVDFPVNKILTYGDVSYMQANYQQMQAPFIDRLNCMFTAPFYFEYTAKGIDKAAALQYAMQAIEVKPEECIAFGDERNDISMLQFAGIGVAMGNAVDAVKEIADDITDTNDNDGIAKSLYQYLPELF